MIASERRRTILEMLRVKGVISLKDAAKELGVAEITVRRDLEKMEVDGKLKRVQGGAASLEEMDGAELAMSTKFLQNAVEKEILAAYAAGFVKEGDSVFIDGGTTMIPLANILVKKKIKIITHSTSILHKLNNPTAQIIIIGGEYLPHYNMNLGPMAQEMLRQFYFDRAFLGCAGVDVDQQIVYTTEHETMTMKRIAMENSKNNYLLVDSSKFEKRGFLKLCGTDDFDAIISDQIKNGMEKLPHIQTVLHRQVL